MILNIAIVLAIVCMSVFLFTSVILPVSLFLAVYISDKRERRKMRKLFEQKMKRTGLPKKCWYCKTRGFTQQVCCDICAKEKIK